MKRLVILSVLSSITLFGCLENEAKLEGFNRRQLERLLSVDSVKFWQLSSRTVFGNNIDLGSCNDSTGLLFKYTASGEAVDSLYYVNYSADCQTEPVLLEGHWFVPMPTDASTVTDTLGLVFSEDSIFFSVKEITPEYLRINSLNPTDSLVEIFY